MKKEENVCVKTEGTEEKVVMENGAKGCCENASAVPPKFKDVDALARAYSALQSEFTRRSQRLKELERKVENLEGEGAAVRSGAEKLRKNAQARRANAARFDSFLAETVKTAEADEMNIVEDAALTEEPTEEQPLEKETLKGENGENETTVYETNSLTSAPAHSEDGAEKQEKQEKTEGNAQAFFLKEQAQGGEGQASVAGIEPSFTPSETLYAQVCRDEGVRLRIIGEYLSSIGKSGAPLMTGGVGTFTTPPRKAVNITEAGNMALLYFKKPTNP